tara:strand:+ start:26878 stop:27861 length:984 start_codon:yes stop_codon:yes gene_type:complete
MLKTFQTFSWIVIALTMALGFSQEIPQADISNGVLHAKLYLPDAENGYYRATRFDWSGLMPHLEFEGHTYFGKWFKNYDPKSHESVMGPVEAFSQIGYEEAKVGEEFLKIGVGTLVKPKEPKHLSHKYYEIRNSGKWEISKKPNELIFKHLLNTSKYTYEYVKSIRLTKGKPEMMLHHKFTNTGPKTIETQVFNHNFFFIDKQPIGKGYVVKFPYTIEPKGSIIGIDEFAKISTNKIEFIETIPDGKKVYIQSVGGFDPESKHYEFSIENRNTGAGVKVVGNKPLTKLVFWSSTKTLCPEPYFNIEAKPGETIYWDITYTFYNLNKK